MKRLRLWLAAFGLIAIVVTPSIASADVNDFTITSFKSDQQLTRNDPQGELNIIETINVRYTDYNHGILRAIPKEYKRHALQLKVNSIKSSTGAPTQYTTYTSNGNTVLKIGSPSRTITGDQQYTINYTVRNVISFYPDHDELYWDVNGDQWAQPFDSVSVKLGLPEGLEQAEKPACYTGSYGSNARNCTISTIGQSITASTTKPLIAGEGMTYVAVFEKGYFQPSHWYETVGEHSQVLGGIFIPVMILGMMAWTRWYRYGRDPKGSGVIVPQYDAPDNLSPLSVGSLMDFAIHKRDITATIIDLAVRGYIKINETKKVKKLAKDKLEYSLILQNTDLTGLDEYEKDLMNKLFTTLTLGEELELSKSANKLYSLVSSLNGKVKKRLIEDGYFSAGKTRRNGFKHILVNLAVAIVLTIIGLSLFGAWIFLGIGIGLAISGIFLAFSDARTARGVAAKEHIEGLKLYLNVAEKDRLDKLQGPNAKYIDPGPEPKRTVKLFEKLLPYAIVLGVEAGWAKQFESLYTSPPDWYSGGHWTTFNSVYLVNSLNSGVNSAVSTAFSAPSSSGSSGSGGGGFSGGGGGGGGGGGW